MTSQYKLINNIGGWAVFVIAMIVYMCTIEPTVSFWDCGEYIATSYKLEVGHPPGAPLFMMFGRLFSFFVDIEDAAYMINLLSATCSAVTIMFLFWTITHFAHKMVRKIGDMEMGGMIAVIGSGFIGAVAFTFSDSFWFSAVEGEVYAMSGMFTAITFWAILRWERVADEDHSDRWLILIAYLVGLSIGVHLLNLLCIPAIAMIFYYRRFKNPNLGGVILTGLVSIVVLGLVQNIIIPGLIRVAFSFELGFVNGRGMPFNSGSIAFIILIIVAVVGLTWLAHAKKMPTMSTIVSEFCGNCCRVFFFRYDLGFALTRTHQWIKTNPENVIRLLSYLNREQYGTWPLLYGQQWNTPVTGYDDGNPVYFKDTLSGEYTVIDDGKGSVPIYDPEFSTVFPRMWRSESNRVNGYKVWTNYKGKAKDFYDPNTGKNRKIFKPTFGDKHEFLHAIPNQLDVLAVLYVEFLW